MNPRILIVGAVCLAAGVALGSLLGGEQRSDIGPASPSEKSETTVGSTKNPADSDSVEKVNTRPFGVDANVRTREEMAKHIRDLQAKLAAQEKENEDLKASLAEQDAKKAATLKSVRERLEKLGQAGGLAAYGDPAAWSKMMSDLRSLGPAGVDLAIGYLSSDNPGLRVMAAKILEDLSDPRAVPDLARMALEDKNEMARNMASHALAFMKSDTALPALRDLYENSTAVGVKINSLAGLALQNDARGLRDTAAYIADGENPAQLRQALCGILAVRSDPHLMPVAAQVAQTFGESEQMMGLVINYYDNVGAAAAPALQAIIDNPATSQALREAAQQALTN